MRGHDVRGTVVRISNGCVLVGDSAFSPAEALRLSALIGMAAELVKHGYAYQGCACGYCVRAAGIVVTPDDVARSTESVIKTLREDPS